MAKANCERIFVVEDDPELLALLAEVVGQHGVEAVPCCDAAAALAALERGPLPDLVVLDLALPDMPAEELLRRIRSDERWRAIPIAAMSGHPASRFGDVPVDAFLPKPFEVEALEEVVSRLCGTTSASAASASA